MRKLLSIFAVITLCLIIFVTNVCALEISSRNADKWKIKSKNGKTKLKATGINTANPLSNYFAAEIPICLKSEGDAAYMNDHYNVGNANELPVHQIYISPFYMDKYEVSNEKMRQVMQWAYDNGKITANTESVTNASGDQQTLLYMGSPDSRISFASGIFSIDTGKSNFPCVEVTWYGACAYSNFKSEMESLTSCYNFNDWSCDWNANGYRLPTEAEWEKAARGGLISNYYSWASSGGYYTNHLDGSKANYYGSGDPYDEAPTPCGYYDGNQIPAGVDMANGYGLYDMTGNVSEWVWDWYQNDWYSQPGATNANTTGPSPASVRLTRGGNWDDCNYDYLRSADRVDYLPFKHVRDTGFRCVRR